MASNVENTIRKVVAKGIATVAEINRQLRHDSRSHSFLGGIHAPLHDELTLTGLHVTGTIPDELSGLYARIGPNPFKPDTRGYHWFIGDGMVHGLRLKNGEVQWYRNRYIRSRKLEAEGGPASAPGPRRGTFDTVNTNVMRISGKTMALVEAGSFPVELSDELGSIAYSNFAGSLNGPFTAHPHEDPSTGELHAVTYDAMTPNMIWHVALNPAGEVVRELPIPVQHGPSIHDCAFTKTYVLVFDLPVTFSMKAVIGGAGFPYRWNPEHSARVGLLPKDGAPEDVIWCDVDPCYVFHVANSFDQADGSVVVDVAVYETMFAGGSEGPNGKSLGLERWTIDPRSKSVKRRTIDRDPQEFPRPDERFFGREYRYVWAIGLSEDDLSFVGPTGLIRHDLLTGERSVHDFGIDQVPGEFVFVPRHLDAAEGDGWMMGYVIDRVSNTTDLVILDASDMAAAPLARVHIPHRIPPGFHGNWLPD